MLHNGWCRRWMLTLAVFGVGSVLAEPAHYVVFETSADAAAPRALFYAEVDLAPDPGRDARPRDALHPLPYRSLLRGQPGKLRYAEQPELRAEFARDPARAGSELESFAVTNPRQVFVVRVPLAEADAIAFDHGAQKSAPIDLTALARNAALLPLAHTPRAKALRKSTTAGPAANRVDILVLGDGYKQAQSSLFADHARALFNAMFAVSPHAEYANLVNWTEGFIASAQSGADHPPFQSNCAPESFTCCGDRAATADTLAGQFRDTALDARFCTVNIHRLLTVDAAKVFAAAAEYPDWDRIFVTVNDPIYGGSGGYLSVTSAEIDAAHIAVHEFGHSFARLADEYETPYPGYPACSDLSGSSPCEANVTDQTDPALIKWAPLLTPGTAIPSPPGTAGTGLFEGARYQSLGIFRPTHSMCRMRSNTDRFCPVCAAQFVHTLYTGGFGTPMFGIDLIEPGSEAPSPAAPVIVAPGSSQVFSADVLVPSHGAVTRRWYLDGVEIAGANTATYEFTQAQAPAAIRTLELRVHDDTALLPAAMAGALLEHRRSWTIRAQAAPAFAINQGMTGAWFNPATSGQGMLIDLALDPKFMFVAWFTFEKARETSANAKVGSPDHRWLTASGAWTGNVATLTLYASAGGVFDSSAAVTTAPVGTLTLTFHDCTSATAVYSIPAEGLSGTIPISRSGTIGMGQVCQALGPS